MDAQSVENMTRQVYWAPAGKLNTLLHQSTYAWLVLALAICGYGIYRHVRLWRKGQKEVCFDKPLQRIRLFFVYILGQKKVLRSRRERDGRSQNTLYAALMHGFIFYSFCWLFLTTTVVALKDYGIVDVYHGPFYILLKIGCQFAGVFLCIGLVMAIARRMKKVEEFRLATDFTIFYIFLFLLVVQGFLLQTFRIAFEPTAVDANYALLSHLFAPLLTFGYSVEKSQWVYSGLWYTHMLTTMGFIAIIPFTRALHIVTSILNLLTKRLEPAVLLPKMDFENLEAEYFGAKNLEDFSWKDLLSFDSCTECRRCTDVCPANAVGKPLDPRSVILKLRDSMRAENVFAQKENSDENGLFESGVINQDEIWNCTNCGACVNECPVGIDQLRTVMQLRRYQTLSLANTPNSAGKAIENIKQYGNPWGLPSSDRFQWAANLDVPVITAESPEVEYLYFVGCAGSYDSPNQKVARAVVKLLKHANISFAVMGKAERCNGEPVKRLGDEYSFSEIAASNVENLNKLKFKKVVTHCPHCFNTLKNDYKEYGGNYEVYHHTQLLSVLYKNGQLKMGGEVKKEVTFHDPCFLGRHNGEYQAPRDLLEAVAGLRMHEMELSKERSSCCGMGGGNMWYESEGGGKIVENRLQHVGKTEAKTLVTGCSFCLINFKTAFSNVPETKDLEIMDVAEVVLQSVESRGSQN